MVNALAGLSAGMDFTQGLQNTFDNSRLNRLAGMAYEAPQEQRQSLLGKMATINPQAAQAQQQQFQSDDDRKMKQVVGAARYMKSAMDTNNPAALAGAWRAVRPGLIRAGLANEDELSPDWDPSYAETVHQVLAMGDGQGGTGGMIQSQKVSDDGYIINTYRDGRMEKTAQKVDRQMWFRDHPGMEPQLVGKDGSVQQVGMSAARPSPAQEAAATERAKLQAQLDYLPQQQAIETQGAIDRAVGTERGKAQVEREAAAPKRIKQYEQSLAASKSVRDALDRAIDLTGPTTTGWAGARMRNIEGSDAFDLASQIETVKANLGFDRLQQMRDNSPTGGALGAIAVQELVALQSTIANLDPNQSDGQLKANLQKVQQHYKNWEAAVQQALADEKRSGGGAAPAAGQRTIVRTGTSNGRKVIQYSDGSVEYGN